MAEITVNIRCSNGDKFEVSADPSSTVLAFKSVIGEKANVAVDLQRLIYKGRILKDEDTLESYAIKNAETVHLVKRPAPTPAAAPAPATATATSTPSSSSSSAAAGTAVAAGGGAGGAMANPFGFPMGGPYGGGGGGMGGAGAPDINRMQQQLMSNPEMMANIMNSPMMQNMLNDPDVIRNMMVNNPQMRQLMENNPQLSHVLNDPAVMQQALEAMRSPAAMREMMRNQDRAMSNIEAHPEGFNALRRMYQDVQEPMMQATADMANQQQGGGNANARATSSSGNTSSGGAFPNPWAAGGGGGGGAGGAGGAGALGVGAGGGAGGGAANPWAGMMGGVGGMGGGGMGGMGGGMGGMGGPGGMQLPPGMTQEMMDQMLADPGFQRILQSSFQNPQLVDTMIQSNPMLRQMVEQNPEMRAQIPQIMSSMSDPRTFSAMMRMQQSMAQLQQQGALPPMGGAGGMGGMDMAALSSLMAGYPGLGAPPAAAPANNNIGGLDFSNLLAQHGQPVPPPPMATGTGAGGAPDMASLMQLFAGLQPPTATSTSSSTGSPSTSTSTPAPAVPVVPPEERYASQLSTLDGMGFTDRAANIRALVAAQGNVNIAVERLLSGNM